MKVRDLLMLAGIAIVTTPCLSAQSTFTSDSGQVSRVSRTEKGFKGHYGFSIKDSSIGVSEPIVAAGSIAADGRGNIVGGVEDMQTPSGSLVRLSLTGSYFVNDDGTISLSLESSQMLQTFTVFVTEKEGAIETATMIEEDGSGSTSGSLVRQKFLSSLPLSGNFNFSLTGNVVGVDLDGQSGLPVTVAGNLDIDRKTIHGLNQLAVGGGSHRQPD